MASWFRPLDAGLWGNAKFRSLSRPQPNGQTLWIYLLTGEHTHGLPGLYVTSVGAIADALGWDRADLRRVLAELEERGMVRIDADARVVYLPNALKYQPPQNPSHLQGWAKEFRRVPDCGLKTMWLDALRTFAESKGTSWVDALEDSIPSDVDTVSDTVSNTGSPTGCPTGYSTNPNPNPNPKPNPKPRGGSGKPDDAAAGEDPIPYAEVTTYLNNKSGKRYREGREATRKHIRARWHEGFRLEDFRAVIDGQCAAWRGGDMEKYLRPETVFGPKFESYLNAKGARATGSGASAYRDLELDTPSQEESDDTA